MTYDEIAEMNKKLAKRDELLRVATRMFVALIPYQMEYGWDVEDLTEMAIDDAVRLISAVDGI